MENRSIKESKNIYKKEVQKVNMKIYNCINSTFFLKDFIFNIMKLCAIICDYQNYITCSSLTKIQYLQVSYLRYFCGYCGSIVLLKYRNFAMDILHIKSRQVKLSNINKNSRASVTFVILITKSKILLYVSNLFSILIYFIIIKKY